LLSAESTMYIMMIATKVLSTGVSNTEIKLRYPQPLFND
jgi:hypothetical protein